MSTTNNCIYAHTGSSIDYPPFINISRDAAGNYPVTVRSAGNGGREFGNITLTPEQLEHLATDAMVALHGNEPAAEVVTDDMVSRFLAWTLPKDFAPDGGIVHSHPPGGSWPIGTNLLTAEQARKMLEHVLG